MELKQAVLVIFSLFLLFTTVSAQGVITDDFQSQSPSEILLDIPRFIGDMLHFPDPVEAFSVAIWLGGIAFTLFGFRLAVGRFDSKLGGWINGANVLGSTNRDYWFIASTLALMFIGTTNFIGWINDLTSMLVVGAVLLGIGLALRTLWEASSVAGGQALNVGHQARTGWLGQNVRAAADAAQSTWGGSGSTIDTVYNNYKNIPRCDNNGHLNPGASSGDACWTGCGGHIP